MRVLQLITQARGGPVDHAVDVALELDRMQHESHLVGPVGEYGARLAASGVHWHPLVTARPRVRLRDFGPVARVTAEVDPDVLHLQDRRAGLVGRLVGRARGVPSVYTLHGVPDSMAHLVRGNIGIAPPDLPRRLVTESTEGALGRLPGTRVVTPCSALADFARDHLRVPQSRLRVVHNGVPPGWTEVGRGSVGHPGPARPPLAVWLGVMDPGKRVASLVETVLTVPGLNLLVVGDGPCRGSVQGIVEATGSRDRVRFAGHVADPGPLLRSADLFVMPSAAEACPMAMLQAMACGLPVVSSRAGGIPEIVRDRIDGLLVPTGDDAALAGALRRIAADPDMRRRMGASAAKRVRERFSIDRCTAGLLDVYAEVAQ